MSENKTLELDGFEFLINRYLHWLATHNYSETTGRTVRYALDAFMTWAKELDVYKPSQVTKALLESYKRYLVYKPNQNTKKRLTPGYIGACLSFLNSFFGWCQKQGHIGTNPMDGVDYPKKNKNIVRTVLEPMDCEHVLNQTDVDKPIGIRDRAILETFYSTGIRRAELVNLDMNDVSMDHGMVMVRLGKGKKDRLIPIGERAIAWIDKYVHQVRPLWLKDANNQALFINKFGSRFSRDGVNKMVRSYFDAAGIKQKGGPHVLRHSFATAMLNSGADIRHIQEMLGHESLSSTQIYTKVAIEKLKEVHERHFPGKMNRD